MHTPDLLRIARDGAILSVLASAYLIAVLHYNPRLFLQDYPQEIQQRVPPKTAEERRQSLIVGIPFLLLLIAVPFLSTLVLQRNSAGAAPFVHLFLNAFGVIFAFNLVDLLVLDWWMFCTVTPRFLVIPGTEGVKAYKDYAYHWRASLKGTVLSVVGGALIAGIVALL